MYTKGTQLKKEDRIIKTIAIADGAYLFDDKRLGQRIWLTEEELKDWELVSEGEWWPEVAERYFFVTESGEVLSKTWGGIFWDDNFRLSVGNVHKTREDAEAYKKRWQELMGKE